MTMRLLRTILHRASVAAALVCLSGVLPLAAAWQGATQGTPKQLPDYRLGPQDVITINVMSGGLIQPDFSARPVTVANDGRITVLGIPNPLEVSGKTTREVEALIKTRLIELQQYSNPTVEIVVSAYRAFQITVQGAVRSPGRVQMSAERMTLSEVVNSVGGLTPAAGTRVKIKGGPKRPAPDPDIRVEDGWEVYAKDDLQDGRLSDVRLYEDDQVFVEVAPKFYVNGQVKTPGDQQWEPNLTVERALIKAGGLLESAAKSRIKIRRQDPKTKKYKDVKMDKDRMSMLVEPEDLIEVPKRRW